MDEIDSIGYTRMESGTGNGDSEVQHAMLELLNQLDGFEASNKIKVLMATNRIDILDQALLRPDRIDRKIEFPNPNEDSRFDILKIHSRKMNLMRVIDLKKIAEKMNGASGAELKAVCTKVGMFALRERRVHVTQEDFEMAVAKTSLGQMLYLIVTHSGPDYLAKYSIEGYRRIVKYKTSYYPFYLPAACALLVWCKAGKLHWAKGYSY